MAELQSQENIYPMEEVGLAYAIADALRVDDIPAPELAVIQAELGPIALFGDESADGFGLADIEGEKKQKDEIKQVQMLSYMQAAGANDQGWVAESYEYAKSLRARLADDTGINLKEVSELLKGMESAGYLELDSKVSINGKRTIFQNARLTKRGESALEHAREHSPELVDQADEKTREIKRQQIEDMRSEIYYEADLLGMDRAEADFNGHGPRLEGENTNPMTADLEQASLSGLIDFPQQLFKIQKDLVEQIDDQKWL